MQPITAEYRRKISIVGGKTRTRAADDPELVAARREMQEAKLATHIARVLAEAPPLTGEQRARLAALLTGGAS